MITALALLSACSTNEAPQGEVALEVVGEAPLVEDAVQAGRPPRRMNIDQLSAAIQRVTGKHWEEADDDDLVYLFDKLSGTLGKPEFLDSTEEDRVPGLLFQKFLDDAATATCRARVAEDGTLSESDRVFVKYIDPLERPTEDPEAVRRTMQRALLLFHGRDLALDDPRLDQWVWLVEAAYERTAIPTNGWRTACVGLITHPDFYTY